MHLILSNPLSRLLGEEFIEAVLRRYFQTLFERDFEPKLADHCPVAITFAGNGRDPGVGAAPDDSSRLATPLSKNGCPRPPARQGRTAVQLTYGEENRLKTILFLGVAASLACGADEVNIALEPPRFNLAQVWRIAAHDSSLKTQFVSLMGSGTRLPDGRIVFSDNGAKVVRVLSADGTSLDYFGREGGGPGEFDTPMMSGMLGDTLYVWDLTSAGEIELFDTTFTPLGRVGTWESGGYGLFRGPLTIAPHSLIRDVGTEPPQFDVYDSRGEKVSTIVVDTAPRTAVHRFLLEGNRSQQTSPITAYWRAARMPSGSELLVLSPGDLFGGFRARSRGVVYR